MTFGANDGQAMLRGLKVLDLTTVVFGPYCTQILADFGADVIKVEAPGGDMFRYAAKSPNKPGMSPGYIALNRGKKSLELDLKQDEARERLCTLPAEADVVIHNIRHEAIERLGFGYEAVRALREDTIYVHCVGFGSNGPYAGLPAYDDVIQAASGTTSLLPRVDGNPAPRFFPSLIADKVSGLHAVYATMAAVIHRMRTGEGQFVEVPMLEAFTSFMMKEHLGGMTFDPQVGKECYARQIDPHRQPFPTRDGYVSIVPYRPGHFLKVIALLGDEDFGKDDRFADPMAILRHSAECYGRIAELSGNFTTEQILKILRDASIPAMPAHDVPEVIGDEHLQAAGFFCRTEHPTEGTLNEMREPSRFSAWEQTFDRPAPTLGQHNEADGGGFDP